ncbi:MAG: hypothetical protein LBN04_03735 [Oscillospiraceae bacterium]|jgi:hypothetical protein|nr:hypothetical protein [Oscillospiraceae bacterium]
MKTFWASLCYKGAHGGGLYLKEDHLEFRTNKLQLPADKRRMRVDYKDIVAMERSQAIRLFPAVTLTTSSGEAIKFILFNRNTFINQLKMNGVVSAG